MKIQDPKKCVNPWLGLLMIAGICAVMTIAIFFEFSGKEKSKTKSKHKTTPVHELTPVAFQPFDAVPSPAVNDKLIF